MRKLTFFLLSLTFFPTKMFAAGVSINFQNNFGYTIVDVSQAMDIPEYSDINKEGLVNWNQFNYKGLIQVLFSNSENVSFGPEVGFNRLYYWEQRDEPPLGSTRSTRWYWGTIWTGHLGAILQLNFASHYYVITGAGFYVFLNESGTTVGFPLAIGHELPISKVFTMPIEFRMDVIFGNAVPIALGGGVGLKFNFGG